MALSTAQGFIGAGDLYISLIGAGDVRGPLLDVGNATKFGIKPNADLKQQISKKRSSYGNPLESVALQKPSEGSMTIETLNRANLRYAFMGEDAAYSQTAGTVSGSPGETVIAALDGWVQLAHEEVSSVVLKDSTGTTTYVLGTDYEVNSRLGMIRALSSGSITEAESLRAAYSYASFTGAAIRGNVKPQIRAYLLLDGKNLVDDSIGILICWEALLTPTSEFDWFKDDFNTIELAMQLKVPVGKTEPFIYKTR